MIDLGNKLVTFYGASHIAVALKGLLSYFIRFRAPATSATRGTLGDIGRFILTTLNQILRRE